MSIENFETVLGQYRIALYGYIRITHPDKSSEFRADYLVDEFNGIIYDHGIIKVRKSPWNPLSHITVYWSRWEDGVDECVKKAIEQNFIDRTKYWNSEYSKLDRRNTERAENKLRKERECKKSLIWICKK